MLGDYNNKLTTFKMSRELLQSYERDFEQCID